MKTTATVYGDIYKQAGSPKAVRGLVTNVSNYNAVCSISPNCSSSQDSSLSFSSPLAPLFPYPVRREQTLTPIKYNVSEPFNYTDPNPNWDESKFHAALAPELDNASFPAHFIVDTGRSGAQPAGRLEWGHWCNIKDAGFGIRPSSDTPTELLDAFVWVKPGGEGDGTSDETAARYDEMCSSESSVVPAPEAGEWFQEYFEMLIKNADPPFGKGACKPKKGKKPKKA